MAQQQAYKGAERRLLPQPYDGEDRRKAQAILDAQGAYEQQVQEKHEP